MQGADRISNQPPVLLPYKCKASILFCVLDGLNTEENSIKDQTVYYDIRFKATLPGKKEPVQLIINLEMQMRAVNWKFWIY